MPDTSDIPPAVSVVMPTYKRPDLLPRAVESVAAQAFRNWELIIADDEDPAGETWRYLQSVATRDKRIRVFQNPGPHGQIGNNNFVMRQARAPWIKPLYDDDAFKPDCLTRFVQAVQGNGDAAVVCCLADNYVNNRLSKRADPGKRDVLERLDADHALLACYVQDVEIGTPVQCMVRRELVEDGVWWEDPDGMSSAFDTWWLYRLIARGDLLLLNEALVNQHWGHETGTSAMQANPELMDADILRLKELLEGMVPAVLDPPPFEVAAQMVRLMRAMLRWRDKRRWQAIRMASGVWRVDAWRLAARWLANKRRPGSKPLVEREAVWPRE